MAKLKLTREEVEKEEAANSGDMEHYPLYRRDWLTLEAENKRLAEEWQQCHNRNAELLDERSALKQELAAAKADGQRWLQELSDEVKMRGDAQVEAHDLEAQLDACKREILRLRAKK